MMNIEAMYIFGNDMVHVYSDGEWKWFHEQVCPDIWGEYDHKNWAHDDYLDYISGTLKRDEQEPVALTDNRELHKMYCVVNTVQRTVEPPEPYATLDENHTYSPGYTEVI